jgi:hypothetical protein
VKSTLALLFPRESQLHFNKGGNKMATNNKPANTLRCGNIKVTIWQNVSEKGSILLDNLLSAVQGSVRGVAQWDVIRSQ